MRLTMFAAAAGLLLALPALAQTPAPPGGSTGVGGGRFAACREDAQKFCADKHGPDRRACMQDNKDKLSDGCKAALATMRPPGGN